MGLRIDPSGAGDKDRVDITGGANEAKDVKIYSFSGKLEKPGKLLQKAAVFFGFAEKIKDSQSNKEYYVNIRSLGKHSVSASTPSAEREGSKMGKALAKVRNDVKGYFENCKRGLDFLKNAKESAEAERSRTYAATLQAHQEASIGTNLGPTLKMLESSLTFAGTVNKIKKATEQINYEDSASQHSVTEIYKGLHKLVNQQSKSATLGRQTSQSFDDLKEFFRLPRTPEEQALVLHSIDKYFGVKR